MFAIKKEFYFDATHALMGHHKEWEARLHSHTFSLTVVLLSDELETDGPSKGMVFDEDDITRVVKPLLKDYCNHCCLNQTLNLENPTCEAIAQWLFFKLDSQLPYLECVAVGDSPTHKALYFRSRDKSRGMVGDVLI